MNASHQNWQIRLGVALFTLGMGVVIAAPLNAEEGRALSFEADVRPILKAYCLDCHGGEEKLEGKLDLRLARFAIRGGESGTALVPGDVEKSSLVARMVAGEMPPSEKKVPAEKIEVVKAWVLQGAKTLREEPEQLPAGIDITPEERSYWFFQPLVQPSPPA
ncbi:MAG: c-type cytochrome domain-containing protein, partial [Pirellulales bacterium]